MNNVNNKSNMNNMNTMNNMSNMNNMNTVNNMNNINNMNNQSMLIVIHLWICSDALHVQIFNLCLYRKGIIPVISLPTSMH